MPLGFKPIIPKKDPFGAALQVEAKLRIAMRNFGADAQKMFSTYPPQDTSYRRTGTLGRRWTVRGPSGSTHIKVVVGNRTRYAARVQGPEGEQEEQFHRRGWKNVDDVEREVWENKYKQIIEGILTLAP